LAASLFLFFLFKKNDRSERERVVGLLPGFAHDLIHALRCGQGMYWDHRFPRLLTTEQMAGLAQGSGGFRPQRLRAIADVSCDLGGSLEM
jgi:hypothetical protein